MPRRSAFVLVVLTAASLATIRAQEEPESPDRPAPDRAAMAASVGKDVRWVFDDPVRLREGNWAEAKAIQASAREHRDLDREAELARALAAAKERNRLVLWYVPKLAGPQMYRPAVVDGYMKAVPFSDPDCLALIERKFVPIRLVADKAMGERFGIVAPDTMEPVLVFLRPDGSVAHRVHRIVSFDAGWFAALFRAVLARNPELDAPSEAVRQAERQAEAAGGDPDAVLLLAEERMKDGAWEQALQDLDRITLEAGPGRTARAAWLRGALLRRLGRVDDALAALEGANFEEAARQDAVHVERGRCHLARRDAAAAAASFVKVRPPRRKDAVSPRRCEALYLLGCADLLLGDETFARRRWAEAAAIDAADPFARKAAMNLEEGPDRVSVGPTLHGFEVFRSVTPFEDLPGGTTVARGPDQTDDAAREAVRYLLDMQRESGGWTDSRYAYWDTPDLTPNVWVAQTALACAALLAWRDLAPEAVDRAVRRGEDYAFDERRMARGFNEEIYADAYKLVYLAAKWDHVHDADVRAAAVRRMNEVVRSLAETQYDEGRKKAAGFWAHEYPNPFCTAAVMNGLHLAKERGARVPDEMMARGARALLSVRNEETGAYAYGAGPRASSPKDSMGRAPMAEAAVLWAAHPDGSAERVERAMGNFWEHLPRLLKVRNSDFHTDGELAGFFFWHAIFHTTEALRALPDDAQKEHGRRLLEVLVALGEIDGSFVDSHEQGKSYGTAMALLALKNLLGPRAP